MNLQSLQISLQEESEEDRDESSGQKEGNTVHLTYSKCLCPLVGSIEPLLSKTFCNCYRGWLMESFKTVVGKPVKVKMEDSIMMGGQECRFSVQL